MAIINIALTVLVSLSALFSLSSSSITLPPSMSPFQYDDTPSPLMNSQSPMHAQSPLLGFNSPMGAQDGYDGDTFTYNYKTPSALMAKVKKMCQVVPHPDDCESPYAYPDAYTAEDTITPFNVFMRMVRDIQTSIWIAEAVYTGLRKASLDRAVAGDLVAAARERVRARSLDACSGFYGKAAAEMEDINEYNYGIDYERANAHTDDEYAEAAEKIVDDVFEATFPATERCNKAARNAFLGGDRREAAFGEVRARNEEIKRKYANCKAMAEFMAAGV